jgi:hypothetical protein
MFVHAYNKPKIHVAPVIVDSFANMSKSFLSRLTFLTNEDAGLNLTMTAINIPALVKIMYDTGTPTVIIILNCEDM